MDEEEEDAQQPLDAEERENIRADLEDLGGMRLAFEPQGVKGVVVACPDCGEDHYYGWELLKESLEHMLATGEPRMHEPAYEPRLLGSLEYDPRKQALTRFDVVALGDHFGRLGICDRAA